MKNIYQWKKLKSLDKRKMNYQTSSPFKTSPVNPRKVPSSPSNRGKKKLPPTSGTNPIFVSGIAKTVFSVAILKGACTDRPTPPPTVQ